MKSIALFSPRIPPGHVQFAGGILDQSPDGGESDGPGTSGDSFFLGATLFRPRIIALGNQRLVRKASTFRTGHGTASDNAVCLVGIYGSLVGEKSLAVGLKFGALFGLAAGISMGFGSYCYIASVRVCLYGVLQFPRQSV